MGLEARFSRPSDLWNFPPGIEPWTLPSPPPHPRVSHIPIPTYILLILPSSTSRQGSSVGAFFGSLGIGIHLG